MPESQERFATFDGLRLFERSWLPSGEVAAVLVVVHGFTEHSGRYASLAGELNRWGCAVYALDLRGHGQSEGPRVFVRSFDEYLADVELYLDRVRARQPDKPLFLFGFSMGGTIVARLAVLGRAEVRGLILCGPALAVGPRVFPLLRRLASLMSAIFPKLRLVRLGCAMISRDPRVVAEFRADPLVFHGRFPVRTGAELLWAMQQIQKEMQSVSLPFLILHGGGDVAADPQGSRELYARAASTDKTFELYDGLYHDLLHEPEQEQVRGRLIAWLRQRVQATTGADEPRFPAAS